MSRKSPDVVRESGAKKHWRDGLTNQTEIMEHVHSSELFANCVLIVGKDESRIKIIKEILLPLSPQLESRLSLNVPHDEGGLLVFDFKDVEMAPMRQLIKYAYTHQWTWSGRSEDLSGTLNLLRLSERLGVQHLAQNIQIAIENVMTPACTTRDSSEKISGTARASVMVYDEQDQKWIPSGGSVGQSKIEIYHHVENNTFRIIGKKLANQEIVINCAILRGLKYNQASATFHQFKEPNGTIYGLNFKSIEDAKGFELAVVQALDSLNKSGGNIYPTL